MDSWLLLIRYSFVNILRKTLSLVTSEIIFAYPPERNDSMSCSFFYYGY